VDFVKSFGEYGLIGLVLGTMIWNNITLQTKLMKILENNTQALTSLKEHCRMINGDKQ
jgi:hypothetical protein